MARIKGRVLIRKFKPLKKSKTRLINKKSTLNIPNQLNYTKKIA